MSRKKPGGGRVTQKGTQPASTNVKRTRTDKPGFPAQGGVDRFASKARTTGGPIGPTRSGHHRGNR